MYNKEEVFKRIETLHAKVYSMIKEEVETGYPDPANIREVFKELDNLMYIMNGMDIE